MYDKRSCLIQEKVPVGWLGRFRGRLLLTNRSFRFLARLQKPSISGGFSKIAVIVGHVVIAKGLEDFFLFQFNI